MITKEEVKKIAQLARIRLLESEEESFQKDLSSILGYVESLSEVDTLMVEPTLNAVQSSNIVRQDELSIKNGQEMETAAMIVRSSPDHDDGFIKVKAVM